jgi:DNA-binding CsgD family transcriptional regulator
MLGHYFDAAAQSLSVIRERKQGAAFLKVISHAFSSSHIEYICFNIPSSKSDGVYINCYFTECQARHFVLRGTLQPPEPLCCSDEVDRSKSDRFRSTTCVKNVPPPSTACLRSSVRITSLGGETALMAFGGARPVSGLTEDSPLHLPDQHRIAHFFHDHVLRSYGWPPNPSSRLTAREADCLKWIAAGKTAWEASIILGITERTVRFHLNSAKEKMNCTTTIQAVARAVADKVISL